MSTLVMERKQARGRPAGGGRVRSDSLPEFTRYRDDGCEVSPSCLDCPLPKCRYEEPGGLRAIINAGRDQEMLQLRLEGLAVEELAERFGVSRRTVFRVLNGRKDSRRRRREDDDFAPVPGRRGATTARMGEPIPIRPRSNISPEREKEAHCA